MIEKAAGIASLSQWVQMKIWAYMDTPKLKRDATDVAQEIIDKVALAETEIWERIVKKTSNDATLAERKRIVSQLRGFATNKGDEFADIIESYDVHSIRALKDD